MREIVRTDFGERLFTARKKHAQISQKMLAEAIGTSQSNIAELELKGVGSSFVTQIAAKTGVSAEWLATGKGSMLPVVGDIRQPAARSLHHAAETQHIYGVPDALRVIGNALEAANAEVRSDVVEMLGLFLRNPSANAGLVPVIVNKLGGGGNPQSQQEFQSTRN